MSRFNNDLIKLDNGLYTECKNITSQLESFSTLEQKQKYKKYEVDRALEKSNTALREYNTAFSELQIIEKQISDQNEQVTKLKFELAEKQKQITEENNVAVERFNTLCFTNAVLNSTEWNPFFNQWREPTELLRRISKEKNSHGQPLPCIVARFYRKNDIGCIDLLEIVLRAGADSLAFDNKRTNVMEILMMDSDSKHANPGTAEATRRLQLVNKAKEMYNRNHYTVPKL